MDERAALRTLTHAIKQRLYLFVAIVAGLTVVACIAAIVRPASYQGSSVLFVDKRFDSSNAFDISLQGGQPLSDHFIQTATSRAVLVRACSGTYFATSAASNFRCDATTLMPHVSANTVNSQDWIAVNVTADSAVKAAVLANAVAQAMIDQNRSDIDQLLAPNREYLNAEIKRLGAEIQTEQTAIDKLQNTPGQQAAVSSHQANLSLLQGQYLATYARVQDLDIQGNRLAQSLKLEQQAVPPSRPYDPDPVRYLAAGLVVGLCIGLATVVLVDRFDDRLFDPEDLSTAAGTRLVVAVAARDSDTLSSQASSPYAVVRANLLALHPDLTKVMVVAASPKVQVRPIAAGLGSAAVKAGQKVMVVEADAPIYVMEQQLGRNGSRMTIVSAPVDANGRTANGATGDANERCDLTITLAPPPHANAPLLPPAAVGDVAIVVATAGLTRFAEVRRATDALRQAGIDVAASVLAIDSAKEVGAGEDTPEPDAEPARYESAVNLARLPTWRGPRA